MKNLIDNNYRIFRVLTFICLALIIVLAGLYYFNIVSDKVFAIVSGVIALVAGVFGLFANKPVEKDDVGIAVDKVLLTYDQETFQKLKEAKEQEGEIRDFIESRSNEIFLLKLRTYLQESIETKYKASEIAKLIDELTKIENALDSMNVKYDPIQLPQRFRQLIERLNQEEKMNLYQDLFLEMIDSFPLLSFRRIFRASAKTSFYMYKLGLLEKQKQKTNP